jgi:hypothetical protein
MRTDGEQFDDPSLKAAIRQVAGGHQASPELRQRLLAKLAQARETSSASEDAEASPGSRDAGAGRESGDPIPIRPSLQNRFRIGRLLAIAASLLIVIGGTWGILEYRHIQHEREEYAKNDELLDGMIDVQKDGAKLENATPLAAALSDPAAISAEAGKKLGRIVPVVDLKGQGWDLIAASFCQIDKHDAVRFFFTRGNQSMTVISLPASAWADAEDGDHYEMNTEGHAIAGYIKSGSLNCVVGDESLKLDEATALRDRIRGS